MELILIHLSNFLNSVELSVRWTLVTCSVVFVKHKNRTLVERIRHEASVPGFYCEDKAVPLPLTSQTDHCIGRTVWKFFLVISPESGRRQRPPEWEGRVGPRANPRPARSGETSAGWGRGLCTELQPVRRVQLICFVVFMSFSFCSMFILRNLQRVRSWSEGRFTESSYDITAGSGETAQWVCFCWTFTRWFNSNILCFNRMNFPARWEGRVVIGWHVMWLPIVVGTCWW